MLRIESIECPAGPIGVFEALKQEPYACLLESSLSSPNGRWLFIGVRPFSVLTMQNGRAYVDLDDHGDDPFPVLAEILGHNRTPVRTDGPPCACGAMGFLSYDLGRYFEDIPSAALEDLPQPELSLAFYDCTLAFDLAEAKAWLSYLPSGAEKAADIRRIAQTAPRVLPCDVPQYQAGKHLDWSSVESNFTRADYLSTIRRVKDYIAAGDVYQVNLSQRFSAPFSGDAWGLYKVLRAVNPSPFGCFLDFPGLTLASASPERLLSLDGATRLVETKPIKGTRPRGRTKEEDDCLRAELAASEKDRAENVMIVDMARNDIGKVCDYGSVHVPKLWEIEDHPNVFQMVSTVRGTLAEGKGPADLLAATFPGGSITGAPKVRAMQIIEELEPTRRGIYTGSVGYIDFSGNMDFNIVIRSFVLRNGRAYFHGGGGIVIDSEPEAEYDETIDKVSGLVAALGAAGCRI